MMWRIHDVKTVHKLKSVFSHISPTDQSVKIEANNGNTLSFLFSPLTFDVKIMSHRQLSKI